MEPEKLLFAPTHEWVALDEDLEQATIGISAFALEQLTDLVYIELPEVGKQVTAGESFGEIESVKAVSDLYSPVTGEVTEVNSGIVDALETFSSDPYGQGWIAKIKIHDKSTLDGLLDFAAYEKQCAEEGLATTGESGIESCVVDCHSSDQFHQAVKTKKCHTTLTRPRIFGPCLMRSELIPSTSYLLKFQSRCSSSGTLMYRRQGVSSN